MAVPFKAGKSANNGEFENVKSVPIIEKAEKRFD